MPSISDYPAIYNTSCPWQGIIFLLSTPRSKSILSSLMSNSYLSVWLRFMEKGGAELQIVFCTLVCHRKLLAYSPPPKDWTKLLGGCSWLEAYTEWLSDRTMTIRILLFANTPGLGSAEFPPPLSAQFYIIPAFIVAGEVAVSSIDPVLTKQQDLEKLLFVN